MIHITQKEDCCGCGACMQRCPQSCITMCEDEEGFRYPKIDESRCVHCNLCEKVCPVLDQNEPRQPLSVYAAKNPDESVRMASSSGGVFSLLAQHTIEHGGVVFGARFNEKWEVVHGYTESLDGLAPFRGSKYVQSVIGDCYQQAERFLKEGREVLFSGTPCQIAGLKRFLGKDYDNLLTVDVICHGVPSPLVWREYLKETIRPKGGDGKNTVLSSSLKETPVITGISFRDKTTGWKKFGFVVRVRRSDEGRAENSVLPSVDAQSVLSSVDSSKGEKILLHETLDKNIFMQGFLKNLYLRPSCYACQFRSGKSGSDITIGDFWGIGNHKPEMDDDKGIGLILLNTDKGQAQYRSFPTTSVSVTYNAGLSGNPCLELSCKVPAQRSDFWQSFRVEKISAIVTVLHHMRPSLFSRSVNLLKRSTKRILKLR